jgi:probable rRNA maturation factor
MRIKIDIARNSKAWIQHKNVINKDFFKKMTDLVLGQYPNFTQLKTVELSVLLTSDEEMQQLNSQFRGKDKTTNVLSFPDMEIDWRKILELNLKNAYIYLGDIAFSEPVIAAESEENSISFYAHFTHLTIHSILHLLGYDHIEEDDAAAMQVIEVQLLKQLGINSPY